MEYPNYNMKIIEMKKVIFNLFKIKNRIFNLRIYDVNKHILIIFRMILM